MDSNGALLGRATVTKRHKSRMYMRERWAPLLLGLILGSALSWTFTGRGRDFRDYDAAFEDESLSASTLNDVRPNSLTARSSDGHLCSVCEEALALKEVELGDARRDLRTCSQQSLELLENELKAADGYSEASTDERDASMEVSARKKDGEKPSISVFVGIQTGYSPMEEAGSDYKYEERRDAIRKTWFRSGDEAYMRKLDEAGIVVKFVIGQAKDPQASLALVEERNAHRDFLMLDMYEGYNELVKKSREFLTAVMENYDAKYIVKVDDDVYLKLNRLPGAVAQWDHWGVGYTGCMKHGDVQTDKGYRWYEPQHALIGKEYFAHSWGSMYVLSQDAAASMLSVPDGILRHFENEDVTIGAWMFALDIKHYDDRRLCVQACDASGIAVYDVPHPGLTPVVARMLELHESEGCKQDEDDFGYQPPLMIPLIPFKDSVEG
jgi:hypothetical protein